MSHVVTATVFKVPKLDSVLLCLPLFFSPVSVVVVLSPSSCPRPICQSVSKPVSAHRPRPKRVRTHTHTHTRAHTQSAPLPLSLGAGPFIFSLGDSRCRCRKCLSAEAAAAEPCGFDKPHLIGRKPGEFERTETSTKLLLSGII